MDKLLLLADCARSLLIAVRFDVVFHGRQTRFEAPLLRTELMLILRRFTRERVRQIFLPVALASCVLGDPFTNAQCLHYTYDVIRPPPCSLLNPQASAHCLNELGHLPTGVASCGSISYFIWHSDGQPNIPLNLAGGALPFGINSHDQLVGTKQTAPMRTGYLYDQGVLTLFGTLPGRTYSEAYGIAEDGTVVGTWGNNVVGSPGLHGFVWKNGRMIDLNVTPMDVDNAAYAINDKHQVVGWLGQVPSPPFYGEAYFWDNGRVTPLGYPAGGTNSSALALNNRGDACGYYILPNPNGKGFVRHACAWMDGKAIDLGFLPPDIGSRATGINNQRQIVGYSEAADQGTRAFIWQNGAMHALDDLIPPDDTTFRYAWAINNSGQIAAEGYIGFPETDAFLLTPVPAKPGDVNCDELVNIDDLVGVITRWGQTGPPGSIPADLDQNGTVNLGDLVIVLTNWS